MGGDSWCFSRTCHAGGQGLGVLGSMERKGGRKELPPRTLDSDGIMGAELEVNSVRANLESRHLANFLFLQLLVQALAHSRHLANTC